jgi:sterol desaturase/sphingolipid hydroxylase (fatty acid hydroxylase superfamily)
MPMSWTMPAAFVGLFGVLLVLESACPLRRKVAPTPPRLARNLALGALAFGMVAILQRPVLDWVTWFVGQHALGFFGSRSGWLAGSRAVLSFLILDYTVPFLWRFHLVHHVDRDLDTSTALRFHFGEFTMSIGVRALQLVAIRGDLAVLAAWQAALFASILFHHSNVRLPARLDRALSWLIVTPRMHGIHHSRVHAETDSNWSSLLTIWDRLHGTLRLDVPQERIEIGVPAYTEERDVTLPRLVVLPFVRQRDDWLEKTV